MYADAMCVCVKNRHPAPIELSAIGVFVVMAGTDHSDAVGAQWER